MSIGWLKIFAFSPTSLREIRAFTLKPVPSSKLKAGLCPADGLKLEKIQIEGRRHMNRIHQAGKTGALLNAKVKRIGIGASRSCWSLSGRRQFRSADFQSALDIPATNPSVTNPTLAQRGDAQSRSETGVDSDVPNNLGMHGIEIPVLFSGCPAGSPPLTCVPHLPGRFGGRARGGFCGGRPCILSQPPGEPSKGRGILRHKRPQKRRGFFTGVNGGNGVGRGAATTKYTKYANRKVGRRVCAWRGEL